MNNPIQAIIQSTFNNKAINNGSPLASEGLQAIMSGDAQRGEAIANNILQTYGISKEEALKLARQRFGC